MIRLPRMGRAISTRAAWQPQTAEERDSILRELHEVVASPYFCNSKRYPALLQYVVENTLAGKSDLLKERTLGIEVFDRPSTYDTNAETVVRFTAGEVRKRLLLYYHERGRNSGVRISLPVGSYIPEFLHGHDESDDIGDYDGSTADHLGDTSVSADTDTEAHEPQPVSLVPGSRTFPSALPVEAGPSPSLVRTRAFHKGLLWLGLAGTVVIAFLAGVSWRSRTPYAQTYIQTPLDDFWMPVVHEQRMVLICAGGVVFKQQNNFSGVITAGKDIEYPFVSMQIASAIAQVSSTLARSGVTTQLLSAPSTPLTDLREHSVVLLGAYNNQWAMRLLQSQRFQFTPEPVESIVDQMQPEARWSRDKSLPYSSTDDYALVARFRDATTGSWVVVLAGLGRNGTEAAAQFATNPRYIQMLRDRVGRDFSNLNIEVLLKIKVIEGKTGAPSVLAVNAH
jgi:hypothetical protein